MKKSKIYVGNLSYSLTEEALRTFFSKFGSIDEIKLISDHQTGRSKGFGFITFSSDAEGVEALEADGADLEGRKLHVNTAKDSPPRGNARGGQRQSRDRQPHFSGREGGNY